MKNILITVTQNKLITCTLWWHFIWSVVHYTLSANISPLELELKEMLISSKIYDTFFVMMITILTLFASLVY